MRASFRFPCTLASALVIAAAAMTMSDAAAAAAPPNAVSPTHYPVTIRSCDRDVTFTHAPQRAVSNDINLTEMMLALGLRDRMIGYTGISGWKTAPTALTAALGGLPELARRYPSLETLVGARADLYVAGWSYGMRVGGPVTPSTLAPFGIATYALTESCAHVMSRPAASLDDTYNDLRNLGRIFDVNTQAATLIATMQAQVARVRLALANTHAPLRVFVYDSGQDKPFTAAALAMPTALIEAAGGRNVMDDVQQSWTQVNWESLVARNPEAIVIVDYGPVSAAQKIAFLENNPALAGISAIRARRFIILPYDAATPGVHNAQAVEIIARALHPHAFATADAKAPTP